MTGEIIKSFLVGLGFEVDDSSLAKFNKSIGEATLKVTALYATLDAAAAAIGYGISQISEDFEKMGYEYRIIAPAINKALILRRELLKAYSAAGINIQKVIQSSVKLNMSLAKTRFAFKAIADSVASRFFSLITRQSDIFRDKLYKSLPQIQNVLEHLISITFKALEATVQLGSRLWSVLSAVYDFFVKLDKATDGWSTVVLALVAAWKFLNLSFLATPLGAVLAGLLALLALWDDLQVFKEGGKSLFNWGPAIPIIDAITEALKSLEQALLSILTAVYDIFKALGNLVTGNFTGFFDNLTAAARTLLSIFQPLLEIIKNVGSSLFGSSLKKISDFIGDPNVIHNSEFNGPGNQIPNPVSGSVQNQNSNTNQHVQQQTNINVIGAADAQSIGKSVAGEQNRVNFDMVRNLKGATR